METKRCDPCQFRSKVSRGIKYCKICQETYCGECADVHKSSKATKSHLVMTIKDKNITSFIERELETLHTCKAHPEKQFKFYCTKHNYLICSTCVLQHRIAERCDVFEIDEAGEALLKSGYFEKVTSDLKTMKNQLVSDGEGIKLQQTASRKANMEIAETLKKTKASMIKMFEKFENDILSAITINEEQENGKLENLQKLNDQMLSRMNDAARDFENTTCNGSTSDVFKCIMLIGNFLENCVTENQNMKEPVWICQHSIKISTALKILLNQKIKMIEHQQIRYRFSLTEFPPLKTSYTELLETIVNFRSQESNNCERPNFATSAEKPLSSTNATFSPVQSSSMSVHEHIQHKNTDDKYVEIHRQTKSDGELTAMTPTLKTENDTICTVHTLRKSEDSGQSKFNRSSNIACISDDNGANDVSSRTRNLSESGNHENTIALELSAKTTDISEFKENVKDNGKAENAITEIKHANEVFENSKKIVTNTGNEVIGVIANVNKGSEEKSIEGKPESDKNSMLMNVVQNNDPIEKKVPEKSQSKLSTVKFNITKNTKIELPLQEITDISLLVASSVDIIVCDYHNDKLIDFDPEQQKLKETYKLPAKMINADLLKGQVIASCHKDTANITMIAIHPSFKIIRVLDTQYKAKCVQSVGGKNILVSMRDPTGRWHLHILSSTGQLVEKLNLNRSILDCKSLAILPSDEFRSGYAILQCSLTANALFCYERDGTDIFKLKLKSPDSVTVHDSGFIFVIERAGSMHILSPSGEVLYESRCCSDVTSVVISPSMDKILLTKYKDKNVIVLSLEMSIKSVS